MRYRVIFASSGDRDAWLAAQQQSGGSVHIEDDVSVQVTDGRFDTPDVRAMRHHIAAARSQAGALLDHANAVYMGTVPRMPDSTLPARLSEAIRVAATLDLTLKELGKLAAKNGTPTP